MHAQVCRQPNTMALTDMNCPLIELLIKPENLIAVI